MALLAPTGFPPIAVAACLVGAASLGFAAVFSMCPLMLASFVQARLSGADVDRVVSTASYHVGRILGNLTLAVGAGLIGWALFSPRSPVSPISNMASLPEWLLALSGTAMMVAGISIFARPNIGALPLPGPGSWLVKQPLFTRAISYAASQDSSWLLGFFVGVMPCVPLMPVLATATAAGGPVIGAALGLAFGAGTLLALLLRRRIPAAGTPDRMTPVATGPLAVSTVFVTVVGAFVVVSAAIATIR